MTKTTALGTITGDPTICHFCKGTPTAAKQDCEQAHAEGDEDAITLLAVCDGCAEYWYDGTEPYPKLLPLSALAG